MGQFVQLERSQATIGNKATRLRELIQLGVPVPEAFVLSHADRAALDDTLRDEVAALLTGPLKGARVVVRSSADNEDLPLATAAGVYDTFLGLTTTDEVMTAIAACVSGLESLEARAYRRMLGQEAASMHVILQRMVECDVSGVLYTLNPLSPDGTQLAESVPGAGTSVVAGTGAADSWSVSRGHRPSLPEDWRVDRDPSRLLGQLGVFLEGQFGSPQDIEWGISDGRLHVFQSRDARVRHDLFPGWADRPPAGGARCQVASPGIAVGRVGDGARGLLPSIALMDQMPTTAELEQAEKHGALIVGTGNALSHSAALCREQLLPVVQHGEASTFEGLDVLIDGWTGSVTPWEDLDVVTQKKSLFWAARHLGLRSRGGWTVEDKYETVILDPMAQSRFAEHIAGRGLTWERQRQVIQPYDDPARTYCGTSIRTQTVGDATRLQVKKANVLADRPFRFDQEAHLSIEGEDGMVILKELGFIPFETQERDLDVCVVDGVLARVNHWPGAAHSYLSLESHSAHAIVELVHASGLDDDSMRPHDGKDLFELLGVDLGACRFGVRS